MRPSKEMIFNKLNETRHTRDENTQYSLFPDAHPDTHDIHAEFWYYSDLHNLFGNIDFPTTANPQTMSRHTRQKMIFPQDVDGNQFFGSHVADVHHSFDLVYARWLELAFCYYSKNLMKSYMKLNGIQFSSL